MPKKNELKYIDFQPVRYVNDFTVTLPTHNAEGLTKNSHIPIYVTTVDPDNIKRKIRYNFGVGKVEEVHSEKVTIHIDRQIKKEYEVLAGIPIRGRKFTPLLSNNAIRVKNAIHRAFGIKKKK